MKALTLHQPWATLIAIGAKCIETRSWSTSYRGPLAIHAAKGFPKEAQVACITYPFIDTLGKAGFRVGAWPGKPLPLGAIVATCELVDCEKIARQKWWKIDGVTWILSDAERALGDYAPGRDAWLLANIRPLLEPIPAKGAQGLWEWTPAGEVIYD